MTYMRIEIRDRVTDEGIPYAVLKTDERTIVTDERGIATLDLPETLGQATLSIRAAHYEPIDRDLKIERKKVIIRLRPEII